jgi:nucleoside-diphosphate-sugar epimerase
MRRFNSIRLLIIGCGDVALRAAALLRGRYRLYGLIRDPRQAPALRAAGITPIVGDLDRPATLCRLAGLGEWLLHSAPPSAESPTDRRSARLGAVLSKGRMVPQRLIYISTSGVYGDCGGATVAETRPLNPQTVRAARRMDAERRLRRWGRRSGARVAILRAPGIYAAERLPLERLKAGTPALYASEDSYSNHIHADDLARIVVAALQRPKSGRVYNACDDSQLKMGDYFDLVADHFCLGRAPRASREEARRSVPAAQFSFMAESRRLLNSRMKRELRVRLAYPTVADFLRRLPET